MILMLVDVHYCNELLFYYGECKRHFYTQKLNYYSINLWFFHCLWRIGSRCHSDSSRSFRHTSIWSRRAQNDEHRSTYYVSKWFVFLWPAGMPVWNQGYMCVWGCVPDACGRPDHFIFCEFPSYKIHWKYIGHRRKPLPKIRWYDPIGAIIVETLKDGSGAKSKKRLLPLWEQYIWANHLQERRYRVVVRVEETNEKGKGNSNGINHFTAASAFVRWPGSIFFSFFLYFFECFNVCCVENVAKSL